MRVFKGYQSKFPKQFFLNIPHDRLEEESLEKKYNPVKIKRRLETIRRYEIRNWKYGVKRHFHNVPSYAVLLDHPYMNRP